MPSPCLFNVAGAAKTDAVFHHDPPLFFFFLSSLSYRVVLVDEAGAFVWWMVRIASWVCRPIVCCVCLIVNFLFGK